MALNEVTRCNPNSEDPIIDFNLDLVSSPSVEIEKKVQYVLKKGSQLKNLAELGLLLNSKVEKYNASRKHLFDCVGLEESPL